MTFPDQFNVLVTFYYTLAADGKRINWASSRENLSSGFPTKQVLNQLP